MILSACGASDLGKRRRRNEDAYVVRPDIGLFAVADGMGGHAAGDVASRIAVETLISRLSADSMGVAIAAANQAIWQAAQADPAQAGMGTTITAVALDARLDSEFLCGHVGDSRLYRLRDSVLEQLTRDHSIPRTSMLTRAVGTRPDVEVDVFRASILPGDRFLICSDGLTGMVHDEDLRVILLRDKPLDALCGDLIEAANLRGGLDNITAIVLQTAP